MSIGAAYITRPVLDLDDLSLTDDPYDVQIDEGNALDVGTVTWRRTTAESPFVPGRIVTQAVKDTATKSLRVDVQGSDFPDVQDKIGTLIDAVSQSHYRLKINWSGVDATNWWYCEPADYTVGFGYQHVFGLIAPVTLLIPASPIPISGPI